MADPQLNTLAKHSRTMAAKPITPETERWLWLQIADEIDAYLNGDLDQQQTDTNPDQLTLGP